MAFGLYKPGQGYWVRVMTATFVAVLVLALSAWLWAEVGGLTLPTKHWTTSLVGVTGTAAEGQHVAIFGPPDAEGVPARLGDAVVKAFEPSGPGAGVLTFKVSQLRAGVADPTNLRSVGPADATVTLAGQANGSPRAVPLFEIIYLQAAAVGVMMVAGTILIYWFVGVREGSAEFLIATDSEMKKVNWSTRKDIIGSTWVVLMWCVLLAGGLFVVDFVFSQFFTMIGVLNKSK